MSEILIYDGDYSTPFSEANTRPATPAEIKDAHGKCPSCVHYSTTHPGLCTEPNSPYYDGYQICTPADYCRHHEPREGEK